MSDAELKRDFILTGQVSSARILIVDDEVAQMKALCNTLQDQGYETAGFTSGKEAIAVLKERPFELLLTDLMMPEMDGIALLQAAREINPHLIGILMTGQGTIETAVQAMKSGAMDYILKPFKLSVILPVLSRALAMRQLRLKNLELERRIAHRTVELEEANKELESFSCSVSHDLRAPLRAVEGFTGIVLKRYATEMPNDAERLLQQVEKSAKHMGQLIDDLLRFSRFSRQHLSVSPVNTAILVREVLEELRPEIGKRQIDFQISEMPEVLADLSLLRQVFANLLSNAIKFTAKQPKARIDVSCQSAAQEYIFCVKDNGAGFDMAYAQRLFGVFQRLHSGEEFEGTGVGLSIVQRIVQRHGGRIRAEAAVDQGAAFYFTLPKTPNG
jgi:signal transduction histidine kinase